MDHKTTDPTHTRRIKGKTAIIVYDLSTRQEQTFYGIEPLEALISSAMLKADEVDLITNHLSRERYRKRILIGQISAGLDDFAIKL